MLTHCQESGLGPMHVCMGTTEPMSTSSRSSGRLWVQASELGLIQGVQTIVLTLMDLTPIRLSSSDARGPNLQQEPSLETMVYKNWPEPVVPGE